MCMYYIIPTEKDQAIGDLRRRNEELLLKNNMEIQKNARLNMNVKDVNNQNEHLKEENDRFNKTINDLNEEIQALKNQISKNKTKKQRFVSSENEDKLIEKLQDTWQVLYQELQPEKNTFDDVDQIRDAFKKWKERQKTKYKKRFGDDNNEKKIDEDKYDTQDEYCCYDKTKGVSSLMIFLKDF